MKTIIFPDQFPLSHMTPDNIRLVVDADSNKAEHIIKKTHSKYTIIQFEQNGETGYIALAGFHVYGNPAGSNSPGSKAKYLARSENKNLGLLLQLMEPESVTSHHYHALKTEIYHPLHGEAMLAIESIEQDLTPGKSIVVNKGEKHQVRTRDGYAITLLEIIDDPFGLSMADHNYVEEESV